MHKLLAIAAAILAVNAAHAASVWVNADNQRIARPDRIGQTINPTDGQLAARGIRAVPAPDGVDERFWVWNGDGFASLPQAEIDAILAADAQAAIDAEQARLEELRPRYEAENAFLLAVAQINSTLGVGIDASDSYQSALAKLTPPPGATVEQRLALAEAGLTLRTLWDVVLFHGGEWGKVEYHPEVAQ